MSYSGYVEDDNLYEEPDEEESDYDRQVRELNEMPWFHGTLSKSEAASLLEFDGDFLVRESTTQKNQFILTIHMYHKPMHVALLNKAGFIPSKDRKFSSVVEFISYHYESKTPFTSNRKELFLEYPVQKI